MKRQHYQLTILLLFIIVSIDVSSDRAVTVSAQSGDHYTTPDNQTIPDVEGAFHQFAYTNNDRKADRHVADLNGFLNDAYRLPTSGTYNKEHLQGIQRINERFLIISGAKKGLTNTENRNKNIAPLFIVEEQVPFDYKVIKGLYPASPTGHNPAHPDNDTFWHAGGMSLAGHYLAVPLESDDASKIVFYDVSSIDDLSEDPTRSVPAKVGEILREPVNDRSNKAGIALLTQLPNRHYLLGVWSDFDDLPARLDLYLSMVPDQLRFYADPVRICSKKNKDDDSRCTNPDASQINLTTRIGYIIPPTTFSKYQSMTFIWNEAGKLYLLATYYSDPAYLEGDDHAELYQVMDGDDKTPEFANGLINFTLSENPIQEHHLSCEGDYCNFAAGTGIYIHNGEMSLYAVPHHLRDNGAKDYLAFSEFRPAVSRATNCQVETVTYPLSTSTATIPHFNPTDGSTCQELDTIAIVVMASYRATTSHSDQRLEEVSFAGQSMQQGCRANNREYATEIWYTSANRYFGDITANWAIHGTPQSVADVVFTAIAVENIAMDTTDGLPLLSDLQCNDGWGERPEVEIEIADGHHRVLGVATTYTDRLNGDNRTNTLTYQYGPTLEVINTRTYNTLAHAVSLTEAVPNELTLQWDGLTSWPWSAAAIVLESSECVYGPYAFPGTINLENYRCGGPGIAFQELSPDSGTTYIDRIDKIGERGPDIIDNSSGLMLEAKEGEWVEYNVFVEQPGQYDIVIGVYPVSSWTTFHLELNDEDGINYTSTEPIDIPPTATWSQIRVSNIYLESGSQRLRLVNDAGTIRFDRLYTYLSDSQICNYTNLTPLREEVPFVGEPGRMEMENFACGAAGRAFNELSDITGYGSGIYRPDVGTWGPDISRNLSHAGYHLTSTRNGEFVTYNLRVNQSGTYQLKTYLSSAVTDSQFSISIIDQTTSISAYTSGPLTAPNTGSSDNWIFYSLPETITLPVGVYTLRLDILASGAHFDFITLLPPDQIPSIHAAFDFDMTGTLPLTVDFQDQSYWENTSIIRWAWDFDGDGTIDSHEPSPTYVYTEPGHYIISLTVSDGVLEDTATDYIYIDPPLFDADFDSNITGGYAPLTVSFYDESYTDGTSVRYWAWDFDDDGSIDSTEQHPTYTYTESGSYTVILTISDGNYTDSEEKTDYMFVVGRE
ncbi:MAG: hypothetical protein GFH27_549285n282 [Chloroflexi bacterium AL-W]|nr:hypothetical protein [Chloroflexi bacterium AL-N1]NOK65794.1 hypothetical protein [Chloroflexi bacterium AL-N10]NOK74265.1 hypothetical protein [Chloroflexi bacterium AL-N5]NOK80827.1 hypothetical protein [Chloroflexi bacterium AL-W]NOK88523.1 hypothetical protein [Chloroflexi bacterium AL-N15]